MTMPGKLSFTPTLVYQFQRAEAKGNGGNGGNEVKLPPQLWCHDFWQDAGRQI
jgi:hypothetical protein